jgi:uncharacterized protein YbaR (Trm112 family)
MEGTMWTGRQVAADEVHGANVVRANADRWFYFLDPTTDLIWEVDGYVRREGEREFWLLLLVCPKCQNVLRLDSQKKQFEVSERGVETGEPIFCTWPVDTDGYKGVCPWGAELQAPNKPTKVPMTDRSGKLVEVKIDALLRVAK